MSFIFLVALLCTFINLYYYFITIISSNYLELINIILVLIIYYSLMFWINIFRFIFHFSHFILILL